VPRAGDEAENLWAGVEEVEDLRNEEQAQCLGKMSKNTNDSKNHAREVAVGVSDKDLCGIPVVSEQRARDANPREEKVEREEVRVCGRVRIRCEEVKTIVKGEEKGHDQALRDLNAVNASKHVDALGAEHGDTGHVDVVKRAKIEKFAEVWLKLQRYDDAGDVEIDKVDD
jgi:hypothetical protein